MATGDVKLSDLIGVGVVAAITSNKGYNPTVTWNAAGGYYSAKLSGDDPFMAALTSKMGASAGYSIGNKIKIPFEKNTIQYRINTNGYPREYGPSPKKFRKAKYPPSPEIWLTPLHPDLLEKILIRNQRIQKNEQILRKRISIKSHLPVLFYVHFFCRNLLYFIANQQISYLEYQRPIPFWTKRTTHHSKNKSSRHLNGFPVLAI